MLKYTFKVFVLQETLAEKRKEPKNMNSESLFGLEQLNKVQLTEEEKSLILEFFCQQEKEISTLDAIDTTNVERMVHVMPMENILRKDVMIKNFTRDDLQEDAPESYDGYWQVPRLVE